MKIYTLQQTHVLPVTLMEAWAFFSAPENLALIIGRLANRLFVERRLNAIFEFRSKAVARYFPNRQHV